MKTMQHAPDRPARFPPAAWAGAALIAAALAVPAAAQQQGGFAPNDNPQQPGQQQQQPQSPPAPGRPQVPFEAELKRPAGSLQRRIATPGGLIWTCEGRECTAQGDKPRMRRDIVDACATLAQRAGPVARLEVAGQTLGPDALGRCNEGTSLAGQAPAPGSPVPDEPGQQGGFVPEPDSDELPEGAQTADLDANTLSIVGPEVSGDRAEAVEAPDGGTASVQFLLAHSDNDEDAAGIFLEVSNGPFGRDCRSSYAGGADPHPDRRPIEGIPAGEGPLHLSDERYGPATTYYLRGCPVDDGLALAGPPTNTVELSLLAVPVGGIAMEMPGANILSVGGETARLELPRPGYGYTELHDRHLPTFEYNLAHEGLEPTIAGVVQVSDEPYGSDCRVVVDPERRAGPPSLRYYDGASASATLEQLRGRPASGTYYVRVCPVLSDDPDTYPVMTTPASNVVEVAYVQAPDVEVVSVEPQGVPGRDTSGALYGHAYLLEMTLRNNDAERAAEVLPAYRLLTTGSIRPARIGVGSGASGTVSLDPGETKRVNVFVDLRPGQVGAAAKDFILDHGEMEVQFMIARPDASGPDPVDWEYVDGNVHNNDLWTDFDVARRIDAIVAVPWVERYGSCDALTSVASTWVHVSVVVEPPYTDPEDREYTWREAYVNFNRTIEGSGGRRDIDVRVVVPDVDPRAEIGASVLLSPDGSGSTAAAIGYGARWGEWQDGHSAEVGNGDGRDCPLGSMVARFESDARLRPIE